MAQVYNPQWDRAMPVDDDLMQHMTAAGFTTSHTGGGCMTWERLTDDGGFIWITDDSGTELGQWTERDLAVWLIGRYGSDSDDYLSIDGCTLRQAMHFADTMRAPATGEQSILSAIDYRED